MKISVITATYNHIKSLPKLYESLLSQKKYVHEWIVCDDGSNDGTWEYIKEIAKEGKFNIEGYSQLQKGMRLSRNLNNGLRRATGDLLFFVMGDSYLQDDTLKQLKDTYVEGSAGCGVREQVDNQGKFLKLDWRLPEDTREIRRTDDYAALTGNSMIVKNSDLRYLGYWDEGYEGYGRDDWDIFLRLLNKGVKLYQYNNVRINHVYHGEGQPDATKNLERFMKRFKGEI